MSFLYHRGCKGSCYWDWHTKKWWGVILGVRSCGAGYSSLNEEGMQQAFEKAVDEYLTEQPCVA